MRERERLPSKRLKQSTTHTPRKLPQVAIAKKA